MNVRKTLDERIHGWVPKELKINVIQPRPKNPRNIHHASILIFAGLIIAFPLAVHFLPSNIFPYFLIGFITLMIGASLAFIAGASRFWGKIAVVAIVFGIILGLIASLLH